MCLAGRDDRAAAPQHRKQQHHKQQQQQQHRKQQQQQQQRAGMASTKIALRSVGGGGARRAGKKVRSKNLLDRIEECDRAGQFELDLAHLDLSDWPKETIIVPSIHILRAYRNRFTTLPNLGTFRHLEELDVSRCNLSSIDDVGFAAFHNLVKLNLSRNNIKTLPADLVKLFGLEVLLVDRNQLLDFPKDMHTMRMLRVLDASFNALSAVGTALDKLPALEDLNLGANPDLQIDTLGTRTRRLVDKRALMASKAERRILITRALGVQKNVLTREQQQIFREIYTSQELTDLP